MITVAIADDHRMFADGLAQALGDLPDIHITASAGDGVELLEALSATTPDVLIVDLEMPRMDGITVLERLGTRIPAIVVSMHTDDGHRHRAFQAGAAGFLSKSTPLTDLATAIRAAAAGVRDIQPATLRDLQGRFGEPQLDPGARLLTAREKEVLALLGVGVTSTEELAERLFISKKTVKNHLASIFEKLGIGDRAQAAVEAIRLGLAPRR